MTPVYNSTMSKPYSTYTVTIAFFSFPPREASLAARDPHFPPGIPFKLSGNIYLIIYMSMKQRFWAATAQYGMADIFLCGHLHLSDIDGDRLRRHIYIYLFGDIYIIGTSRNGNVWRSPSVARTRTMSNVFVFWLLCFFFFFTVVWEQGLKWYTPHATLITINYPTNYILAPPPCKKSWAMIIWSKF